jgi:2,3-bisphosphoglycerate-independent phosphoglycerate mutase
MTTNPVALIILDGWGVCSSSIGNAISLANLKYWDYLLKNYPSFLLQASGEAVGLPYGEVGNSEVGHLTIGSGQIVLQSLNRINKAILDGSFFKNKTLLKSIKHVQKNDSALHLVGLLGTGGIHAYQAHLEALVKIAAEYKLKKVYLHLFLDGRDTARDKGVIFLQNLQKTLDEFKCGEIASLSGRFYGMDRNNNWDRIKLSYDTIVDGKSEESFEDPLLAVRDSYAHNIFDEEFKPITIKKDGQAVGTINDNDAVIFFNFRADRARQLTNALIGKEFTEFNRLRKIANLSMTTFTEYQSGLPAEIAFGRPKIQETLASVISKANLKQLHLAETEKYAHVTFFFNGLQEEKFSNEERILIPSPNVETYDLQPEMSAPLITEQLAGAVSNQKFDFYVVNYANPDMVGHTGNLQASIQAVRAVDNDLSKVVPLILQQNGTVLITADHGNAEEIVNLKTGEIDKEHSNFPVPLIIANNALKNKAQPLNNSILHQQQISGVLSDIAPTVLSFLKLQSGEEMKGINLAGKLL